MALRELESDEQKCHTFSSVAPAWAPGTRTTAFGGHVYAQAAWAASRTVGAGMVIHVWLVLPLSGSRSWGK